MIRLIPWLATSLLILLTAPAMAGSDEDLATELLNRTDDLTRGESSQGVMTMHVKTARYERSMTLEMWSEGTEKSLIIIRDPIKEAGTATLKVNDNIWNYLPKVDRTMKVPASMMSGAWMGSHFSNDDLVKESRMSEDYTFALTAKPADSPDGNYVIECTPKPQAPVVWGKVIVTVRGSDKMPLEISYWDERGNKKRTMTFSDFKKMGGRTIPALMRIVPTDKPDEFTEIIYESIDFSPAISASTFTLQGLKQ